MQLTLSQYKSGSIIAQEGERYDVKQGVHLNSLLFYLYRRTFQELNFFINLLIPLFQWNTPSTLLTFCTAYKIKNFTLALLPILTEEAMNMNKESQKVQPYGAHSYLYYVNTTIPKRIHAAKMIISKPLPERER